MRSINVDPVQLESCAARIEDHNQDYQQSFSKLFESVETMKVAWQGKDNNAFSAQIYSFQSDFREMALLCGQYAEFLRNSARSYREIQDDLASQAMGLGK